MLHASLGVDGIVWPDDKSDNVLVCMVRILRIL